MKPSTHFCENLASFISGYNVSYVGFLAKERAFD